MGRREPKPRDTKERIMEAALAEFGARGFAEASIDDVAARAGVTKGAVYYYFTDKADLARDLQKLLADRLAAEAMEAIDPAADTLSNLIGGFDAWLRALTVHDEARFFLRDCWAITEVAESRLDEWVEPIRSMLAEGIARGELVPMDPDALARVLLGAWSEATLHILQSGRPDETVAVVRHLVASLAATRRLRERAKA
jgi:AcrR family transcriptional regulator